MGPKMTHMARMAILAILSTWCSEGLLSPTGSNYSGAQYAQMAIFGQMAILAILAILGTWAQMGSYPPL
jgi:hypothetical protein